MTQPHPDIHPADRVAGIGEYYLQRRIKEVARLNASGADIVSLGIGGPDLPPHPDVTATLSEEAAQPSNHSYQVTSGIPELRDAFARWYGRNYGVELDPASEILPLIGSKEGILHISLAFLNPGDGVLVPDPGYPTYTSVSKLAGAEIFNYQLDGSRGWMPDFDSLEAMPLDRIRLMWVNYPHMPTGAQARRDVMERIVDFGRRHNIVIAHDNPYSFILNDNPQSLLSVPGARDIVIEMNSLSKSHNMAGWRVAMLASNPTFIQWILKVKSNVDSGQFRPVMLAAARALDLGKDWYDSLNAEYARRRTVAERIMTAMDCTFDPAQRGLFLWGRIPDSEPSGEAMVDHLLYHAGVFVTPGFIFGKGGERYVRISLCAPVETLEKALGRITRWRAERNNTTSNEQPQ